MRILLSFVTDNELSIPIDHQEHLQQLVRAIIDGTPSTAADGLMPGGDYHFSNLRSQSRRISDGHIHFAPGRIEWQFASPSQPLIQKLHDFATKQQTITLCGHPLRIAAIRQISTPDFRGGRMDCTCVTPIVTPAIAQPTPQMVRYLRPLHHGEEIERVLVNELLLTHRRVSGAELRGKPVHIEFNQKYIRKDPREGTRKVRFLGEDIIGCYAPFVLYGEIELLLTAWECGLGQRRTDGFGMISMRPAMDGIYENSTTSQDSHEGE